MKISSCQTRRVTSSDVHSFSQGEISSATRRSEGQPKHRSSVEQWCGGCFSGLSLQFGNLGLIVDTREPVPFVEGVSGLTALFSLSVPAVSSLQWAPGISRPERAEARCNAVIESRNVLRLSNVSIT